MEKLNEIKKTIKTLEADVTAFYEKGNKSAGTRLRAGMIRLKGLAQEMRQEVSSKKSTPK
ncbi:uncharacterized membrane protein (DUF106 family) [Pedobacter sp. UYP30]|uniref:histone H1 n=1 Tax=Pedobacter sp. UYP30 TaxID=1756400 RepID=UPI003398CAC2